MPTISVIIPIYNAEPFLPACLDSVLAQTYSDLEIILINDGSTDGSGCICDRYAAMDSRIRVVHQENGGVSQARNRGLELASGELVSFIDSDDTMEPDMYELLVRIMDENHADISHCGYKRFDKNCLLVREVNGTHRQFVQTNEEAIVCMLRGLYFSNALWNKLYRRHVLDGIRFREDLKNNEDVLFNVHAFRQATKTVFIDEGKYHYFDRPTSACNQIKARKQELDAIAASEEMLELVQGPQARQVVQLRIYEARVSHYRSLIWETNHSQISAIARERSLLESSFQKVSSPTVRQQLNHFLLTRTPSLYRLIYRVYTTLRTPNWDAKG